MDRSNFLTNPLIGKTALVTGGTTGIGRATVLMLAEQGAKVLFFGRQQKELDDTMLELDRRGLAEKALGIVADQAGATHIKNVFWHADQYLGKLDILINNAAISASGIFTCGYDELYYVIQTNLTGYLACSREAALRMRENKSGHIVNIGSMSADVREKGSSVYVATKAGIQGFSAALRKELNPLGIKVSLIEPGATGTDMQPSTPEEQRQKQNKLEMLTAEDIAAAVYYVLTQPAGCDVVDLKIRPHLQLI